MEVITTPLRLQVMAIARKYVGTPWHHQGRVIGVGIDCIGLLVCVAKEMGFQLQDVVGYPLEPNGTLDNNLYEQMDAVDIIKPASIGMFWTQQKDKAQHIAIFTDYGLIQAHLGSDNVIETRYTKAWDNRLMQVFDFKEVTSNG